MFLGEINSSTDIAYCGFNSQQERPLKAMGSPPALAVEPKATKPQPSSNHAWSFFSSAHWECTTALKKPLYIYIKQQ